MSNLSRGCILSLNSYWKLNYKLRVCVFVENLQDVEEETERVAILLKGLRIQAIIKPVWLNSESGSVSKEYKKQAQIFKRNQRFAFIRNQRRISKKQSTPLVDLVEGSSLDGPIVLAEQTLEEVKGEKKRKIKSRRSFVVTKISRQLLRHVGVSAESEDVELRDELPLASPSHLLVAPSNSTTIENSPRSESLEHILPSDGEESDGEDDEEMEDKEQGPPLLAEVFNTLDALVQHKILNELMAYHSSESACIFRYSSIKILTLQYAARS